MSRSSASVCHKLEIKLVGTNGVTMMLENIELATVDTEGPFIITRMLQVCGITEPLPLVLPSHWTQRAAPGERVTVALAGDNLLFSIRDQENKLLGGLEVEADRVWEALDFNVNQRWAGMGSLMEIPQVPGLFYGVESEHDYMLISDKKSFMLVTDHYQNHHIDKVWHIKRPETLYDLCTSEGKAFQSAVRLVPKAILDALNTNPAYNEWMENGRYN